MRDRRNSCCELCRTLQAHRQGTTVKHSAAMQHLPHNAGRDLSIGGAGPDYADSGEDSLAQATRHPVLPRPSCTAPPPALARSNCCAVNEQVAE
jgi:hypothetical protein